MSKGINKLMNVSEEFDEVISAIEDFSPKITGADLKNVKNRDISRAVASKLIWLYIKQENLQDENDGRLIWCDDLLQDLSGKKKLKMTEIAGVISENLFDKE
jgi:hypothetical protein